MTIHPGGPRKFGLGQAVRRVEDARLITGQGRYTADLQEAGQLAAVVLRSPHAHARIRAIDVTAARAMPGVAAVYTDAETAAWEGIPCEAPMKRADGSTMPLPEWPLLARGLVRFVGEPVAFVVAETLDQARDAAEAVVVDYEPLPAVPDLRAAVREGASIVHREAPDNVAFDQSLGDATATAAAFAAAARVVTLTVENHRVVANYLEPRAAVASFDPEAGFTLTCTSQGVHGIRDTLVDIMGVGPERLRVITPDVGGGFGPKAFAYREYALALFAAERLRQPVRWVQERTEHFLSCAHGRDNLTTAELALDRRHRILGLRVHIRGNLGAYPSTYGPYIHWLGATMATGPYRVPAAHIRCQGIYSHSVPTDAYRGAGRPEAAYLLERLMDHAAATLGVEPDRLRALNFVPPDAMPYRTVTKRTYDVGEFEGHMRLALERADWAGFPARARAAARGGRLLGIGMACYIECTAWGSGEDVRVSLERDGRVRVLIGTQSNGQGHETAYAQAVSEALDLPLDQVVVVQGDTAVLASGHGTGGSRSIPVGAVAAYRAGESLGDRLKDLASRTLEAAVEDLTFYNGAIRVLGTDRGLTFREIATLPDATPDDLGAVQGYKPADATYPNGTHVAEVEIDPETGVTRLLRYTVVDDFGFTVNPLLLAGQVHGGIAQGVGQALLEKTVYDEAGQLLTASLLDYALPRADDLPVFDFTTRNVPSTTNPLGIKGAGEAGSIGATPAVMNAIADALRRAGVTEPIDMPATPERVWRALAGARTKA